MELLKLEKGDNDITLSQVSAVIFGSNRLSCTFKTNPEDSKGSVQLPDTVCNKQNLWFRTALFWNSTLRRTPKERNLIYIAAEASNHAKSSVVTTQLHHTGSSNILAWQQKTKNCVSSCKIG